MFDFNKIYKVLVLVLFVIAITLGYTAYTEITNSLQEITEYLDAIYFEQSTEQSYILDQLERLLEILIGDPELKF